MGEVISGGIMMNEKIKQGQVRVHRTMYTETFYLISTVEDHNGRIYPIEYGDWSKQAEEVGWKKLSEKTSDTELAEIWELPEELWEC